MSARNSMVTRRLRSVLPLGAMLEKMQRRTESERRIKPRKKKASDPLNQPRAAQRALHIAEILETILLDVPFKDVFVGANGVSRFWHHVIEGSQDLQRKLYFNPEPGLPMCFNPRDRYWERPGDPIIYDIVANPFYDRIVDASLQLDWLHQPVSKRQRKAMRQPEASWRRMLISQSPVIEIPGQLFAFCDSDWIRSIDGQGVRFCDCEILGWWRTVQRYQEDLYSKAYCMVQSTCA